MLFDMFVNEIVFEVCGLLCGCVICDVGFMLWCGEIFGFVGLMGVGCIEVVCVVFGVDLVDVGEICVYGRVVMICMLVDVVKFGIGYLFEDCKYFGFVVGMDV